MGDNTIHAQMSAVSESRGILMLNTFSISQIYALACAAILVLAYVAFLIIGFTRYYKRSKRLTRQTGKQSPTHTSAHRTSTSRPSPNQVLPNGYRRKDYHSYGYSDGDIEYWGLDQPSAPEPLFSGWVIADMMDGEIDFW